MKRTATIASWTVRICGIIQLVLGALIWIAPVHPYVPIHMLTGMILVIALLVLAVLGLRAGVGWPMVALTILWALALPGFGVKQSGIMVGPSHWIIRVVHLLMGVIAIGLGQRLATHILQRGSPKT